MKGAQNILSKTQKFLKRSSPTILSCISVIGVVATAVSVAKSTPKALVVLQSAEMDKYEKEQEPLTKIETVKAILPIYIPSILIGASTIFCILGSNAISRRQQAALVSAYGLLSNSYEEYKKKVQKLYGKDADLEITKEILKDKYRQQISENKEEKLLFYEEFYNDYFESTKEEVLLAEYELNRLFILRGYASLNDFYSLLGLKKKDFGDSLGWDIDSGAEIYGYGWIDFEHKFVTMEDEMECYIISMPFAPHEKYLE